jgi:hypothetical protein
MEGIWCRSSRSQTVRLCMEILKPAVKSTLAVIASWAERVQGSGIDIERELHQ